MKYEIARGTRDFPPPEMAVRNQVERQLRAAFEAYGFQQVQTPIFERFELLSARSGEEIRESMFTFLSDREEYALRPELTAPVCRLIASGALGAMPLPYKLYYVGPCFRYCRPQAVRFREFTQAGLELMGSDDPLADAEVMAIATRALRALGISRFKIRIGNSGIFRRLLEREHPGDTERQSHLIGQLDHLMNLREKCRAISEHERPQPEDATYLRVESEAMARMQQQTGYSGESKPEPDPAKLPLAAEATYRAMWNESKDVSGKTAELLIEISRTRGRLEEVVPRAKILLAGTRALEALDDLSRVCEWLPRLGAADFEVVLGVARGLDFYTGTVFEIDSPLLWPQKQICGGGRYDGLVEEFGGPPLPATGFAFSFDRVVELFKKSGARVDAAPIDVFVAGPRAQAVDIAELLRAAGLKAGVDLVGLDPSAQVDYATKIGARFVATPDSKTDCRLRKLPGSAEEKVPWASVADRIRRSL